VTQNVASTADLAAVGAFVQMRLLEMQSLQPPSHLEPDARAALSDAPAELAQPTPDRNGSQLL
jgi:hypothetical protein